jgi:steroid Delta-isomerase
VSVGTHDLAAAVEEYCRAENAKDKSAWIKLFAEDVVHEDPVGYGPVNVGIAAVGEFWDRIQASNVELWLDAPLIVCGQEVVAIMRCRTGPDDARRETSPIVDHFVFDDDGKITSLRAFLNY